MLYQKFPDALESFISVVAETFNQDKKGYNYRICCLKSLAAVMAYTSNDVKNSTVYPLFVKGLKDGCANVKFTTIKLLI